MALRILRLSPPVRLPKGPGMRLKTSRVTFEFYLMDVLSFGKKGF